MAGYIGSKASVVSSGAERKKVFDITATTTSLTGCSYTPNQVHIFHNGVRLVDGTDYTATDGSTVTLTTAAQSGDEVVVISYATFQTSDTVSASAGGTFSNAVTIDADGATVLTVDRATSDGTIIDLQKNGSSVGSIGTGNSGDLYIGNDDAGLVFAGGADAVLPFNPATVSSRDAAIDLGLSFVRFKNLYLSGGVYLGGTGGVYLGGTGAANYLDDYEEGTFTVGFSGATVTPTNSTAHYTKIGRVVTWFYYSGATTISGASGAGRLTGLPFTVRNDYAALSVAHNTFFGGSTSVGQQAYTNVNSTNLAFTAIGSVSTSTFVDGSTKYIMVGGTYYTD